MNWPSIEKIGTMTQLPDGYRFEQLKRSDIPALIEAIKVWHPDISVGMGSWEREPDALTLYAKLGIIAPEHRGVKLSVRAVEFSENLGRAMGAGFVYGMATLKVPNMQLALEHAGYQLLGFTPGYDRELVAPGVVKRVYEAVYAKVLVPDEDLLRPDPKNLSPKARALFDALFPA